MFLQRVKELTVWRPVWSFRKKPWGRPSKESLFSFLVHWSATWRSLSREKDKKQILRELNLPLDDFPRQKPRKLPKPSKKDHTVLKELGFLTYILGHQGRDYWGGKNVPFHGQSGQKEIQEEIIKCQLPKMKSWQIPWGLRKMKRAYKITKQSNVCPR